MTWIRPIATEQTSPTLTELYKSIRSARGGLAAIHQAQGHNEAALRAHLDLYRAVVFQRSSLSRVDRERIAVTVSVANQCPYCMAHHAQTGRNLGDDPAVIESLLQGQLPDSLSSRDRALLEWARQGARQAASCTQQDVDRLRSLGLDERAVLDAALTVSYFSFVNRLVLMLGVELESDYHQTCAAENRQGEG